MAAPGGPPRAADLGLTCGAAEPYLGYGAVALGGSALRSGTDRRKRLPGLPVAPGWGSWARAWRVGPRPSGPAHCAAGCGPCAAGCGPCAADAATQARPWGRRARGPRPVGAAAVVSPTGEARAPSAAVRCAAVVRGVRRVARPRTSPGRRTRHRADRPPPVRPLPVRPLPVRALPGPTAAPGDTSREPPARPPAARARYRAGPAAAGRAAEARAVRRGAAGRPSGRAICRCAAVPPGTTVASGRRPDHAAARGAPRVTAYRPPFQGFVRCTTRS